ncbi:MAG: bifunctional folylpolyglutamate synthase/dihydrofolate synthase [Bacteroidota bacterium]
MNYTETLDYLFAKLPMFSRLGAAAYKKDLTNTIRLCEALGNPQQQFKSIHIAGTNGKGSTSHMLAAILQTGGYKTGLYTSPHLKDFRERIKVDGAMCSEEFVVRFTKRIKPLIETIEPSFFEITVAMAFTWFAEQHVDIAVIETGLGGRLDSTNIIEPELSIITNIGWDHMNMLGNSLAEIAAEKAGIIKKNIPVVIGEWLPETKPVFEKQYATVNNDVDTVPPFVSASEERWVSDWQYEHQLLEVTVAHHLSDDRHTYRLDLTGIYQLKNLLTVLAATHELEKKGWNCNTSIVQKALLHVKKKTGLHGRWELIHQHPSVILDVGHNADGIKAIRQQLEHCSYQHLHIIIGMVKDKDIDAVLALLPKHASYHFTQAQIPRALNAMSLQQKAASFGLKGNVYADVNIALKEVMAKADPNDLILICGSVFLVGEVIISE